jgi:hypothetical protein
VLIAALVLSILYFSLMALILMDSTRALNEANLFRARIVAATLAENGAERAALKMTARSRQIFSDKDWQGEYRGEYTRTADNFEIEARGTAIGVLTQRAVVRVQGRILNGTIVKIDYTMHNQ